MSKSGKGAGGSAGGAGTNGPPVPGTPASTVFTAQDVLKFLPKSIVDLLEKKPGGVEINIVKTFQALCNVTTPVVCQRVSDTTYEISIGALREFLRERVMYQIVRDRHGDTASRIISIMNTVCLCLLSLEYCPPHHYLIVSFVYLFLHFNRTERWRAIDSRKCL